MWSQVANVYQANACQCIARPNIALLDCMLCLTQYLYDPGILPGSADWCILGKVYLRSNLPINVYQSIQ